MLITQIFLERRSTIKIEWSVPKYLSVYPQQSCTENGSCIEKGLIFSLVLLVGRVTPLFCPDSFVYVHNTACISFVTNHDVDNFQWYGILYFVKQTMQNAITAYLLFYFCVHVVLCIHYLLWYRHLKKMFVVMAKAFVNDNSGKCNVHHN